MWRPIPLPIRSAALTPSPPPTEMLFPHRHARGKTTKAPTSKVHISRPRGRFATGGQQRALSLSDIEISLWHLAQGSFSYSSRSAARLRTLALLRWPPPSRATPSRRRAASSLAYTPSSWV
ncbi:hypothetical protein EYF80_063011 [Liparis tanakae]|uniref:Uncharacterized protein n=1 Tax=Liparis tanakae TaxID=230148 RepID=A0A4Z2EE73_9TELE|nr:hypothetical protein EYF80_063011 [Liparis tanakae]